MTNKVYDKAGGRRIVTVAFRMSVAESKRLDDMVQASGLTKQDYIISRLEEKDVVVHGNPRVYIGLKRLLEETNNKLDEISAKADAPDEFLLDTINFITRIIEGMKGDGDYDR